MFFSLSSILIPTAASAVTTYFCFKPYYGQGNFLLYFLCSLSAFITIALTLPVKKNRRVWFSVAGFVTIVNLVFNFVFAIFYLALSLIIAALLPFPKGKKRLLFTSDGNLIKVKYSPPSRLLSYFSHASTTMLISGFIFAFLLIAIHIPTNLWGVRAFPIDLTEKPLLQEVAVPSGTITCSIAYDNSAIYIDSFFSIETAQGTIPSPAQEAGVKKGDVVLKINNQKTKQSDFILNKSSDGTPIKFEVLRLTEDGKHQNIVLNITPVFSITDNRYMIGINYYDGILPGLYQTLQTVSFYYPDTGFFAATAHSSEFPIEDTFVQVLKTTENLMRDETGLHAKPGDSIGRILHTNNFGSFGKWNKFDGEPLPIAKKSELRLGKASLLSSLTGTIEKYDVYITGTYRIDTRDVICLTVTDEALLSAGGIVKGMSGSPIIQNGQIIGALSNADINGSRAFATFARDMAHELYLSKSILDSDKEALQ